MKDKITKLAVGFPSPLLSNHFELLKVVGTAHKHPSSPQCHTP